MIEYLYCCLTNSAIESTLFSLILDLVTISFKINVLTFLSGTFS